MIKNLLLDEERKQIFFLTAYTNIRAELLPYPLCVVLAVVFALEAMSAFAKCYTL